MSSKRKAGASFPASFEVAFNDSLGAGAAAPAPSSSSLDTGSRSSSPVRETASLAATESKQSAAAKAESKRSPRASPKASPKASPRASSSRSPSPAKKRAALAERLARWFEAADAGDADALRRLWQGSIGGSGGGDEKGGSAEEAGLAEDVDIDVGAAQTDKRSALTRAATRGRTDAVAFLLSKGAVPGGELPFQCALRGHPAVVVQLVESGHCDLEAVDSQGRTLLQYALLQRLPDVARALLAAGAHPGGEVKSPDYNDKAVASLTLAMSLDDGMETARLMVERGADPQHPVKRPITDKDRDLIARGVTPAGFEKPDTVHTMLTHAASQYDLPLARNILTRHSNALGERVQLMHTLVRARSEAGAAVVSNLLLSGGHVDINAPTLVPVTRVGGDGRRQKQSTVQQCVPLVTLCVSASAINQKWDLVEMFASLGGEDDFEAHTWAARVYPDCKFLPKREDLAVFEQRVRKGRRAVRQAWSKALSKHVFGNILKVIVAYADASFVSSHSDRVFEASDRKGDSKDGQPQPKQEERKVSAEERQAKSLGGARRFFKLIHAGMDAFDPENEFGGLGGLFE